MAKRANTILNNVVGIQIKIRLILRKLILIKETLKLEGDKNTTYRQQTL